jgi:hypothetical protein
VTATVFVRYTKFQDYSFESRVLQVSDNLSVDVSKLACSSKVMPEVCDKPVKLFIDPTIYAD